jgi:hypothetical protein
MKTVFLMCFLAFGLASCQKERCWECTIKLTGEAPETDIVCNADRGDIDKIKDSWERHPQYESYNCKKAGEQKTYCWECNYRAQTLLSNGSTWSGESSKTIDTCGMTKSGITDFKNQPSQSPKFIGDTVLFISACRLIQ